MKKDQIESSTQAKRFWMSVEESRAPEVFEKNLPGEFISTPIREGEESSGLDRRDFMKIMGASALMASLAGCTRRPVQKIVPYVNNPEEIIPGKPNFYASADPLTGYGLLVTTREGRPIKVDGNTDHPVNRGAISARDQASIHDLYDPDRLRNPQIAGADASWEDIDKAAAQALATKDGVWILTSSILSPTLQSVIDRLGYRHVMIDSLPMDDVLEGQAQSYGERVMPRYRFDRADYIVSIDADFLDNWGSTVEYEKGFSEKRRLSGNRVSMSKLVVFESMMRLTGQNADRRVAIHPADQLLIALSIAFEVGRIIGQGTPGLSEYSPANIQQKTGVAAEIITEVAKDLVRYRGRGLIVASGKGPQAVALQNVVNFLNSVLDNEGETIDGLLHPSNQFKGNYASFESLLTAIRTGSVKTLIIQGVNPLYLFAESMGIEAAIKSVPNVFYFTSHLDETSRIAKYVLAENHPLESWGDVSPIKDVYSIVQPTIRSLWNTRSLLDCLIEWSAIGRGQKFAENAYEAVVSTWKGLHGRYSSSSFQNWWDDTLMSGVAAPANLNNGTSSRRYKMDAFRSAINAGKSAGRVSGDTDFTLLLTSSIAFGDGSQSNNAILQELPDPVSKNTWGNYLAVSESTAHKNGWKDGDIVKVETAASSVEIPVYQQPGLVDGLVSAHLGYGRKFKGRIGNGVGVSFANFTASATSGAMPNWLVHGVRITKTGKREKIPCTQGHHRLEGRDIVFDTSLEEYRANPKAGIVRHFPNPPSIWSEHEYKGYKWGMAIDLNSCTGCSACVVACSVENNVPAVGKEQVQRGREMQWIRIDRYYSGDAMNPETIYQPMLCQHCDNAPCETVCPVLATTHSDDGLNQMTYNRCVGTKYCSNNCPYKVRRFNWFENNAPMNAPMEHPLPLMKNPEVTLRSRGVMEKCTFCVQRIEAGKSRAKTEGRRAGENDIRTACQDACASDAIVFGDLNDPESKVAKLQAHGRSFTSLEELNAKPAITYLSKVRNRAPMKNADHGGGHH
ncbi:MAG: TAT-variant-translocated molybdopterin oxidoreductase [Oligoflexia bacterium]|nr:TAT-variant-translocated molybdopterin oxidoreductase [Oligoflexia bacterium]